MNNFSRRQFSINLLSSLASFCLLKTAFEGNLFAQSIKPVTDKWLKEVHQLCGDLRTEKVSQTQWQEQIVRLSSQIELPALFQLLDFDRLERQVKMPDYGLAVERVEFPKLDWLPEERGWGVSIFALDEGCAIMPHGHHNMVSMHMILKGIVHVRHYDRIHEEDQIVMLKPTIDRSSSVGAATTISENKDNVHWLKNTGKGKAFTLDVVTSALDPHLNYQFKQFYVDPIGAEKLSNGIIRSRKLSYEEAEKLYRRS
jgi:hypothetical protein